MQKPSTQATTDEVLTVAVLERFGVHMLVGVAALNKISDTLAAFMEEITTLFSAALTQMGQRKVQGTQFQITEAVPGGTDQPSQ